MLPLCQPLVVSRVIVARWALAYNTHHGTMTQALVISSDPDDRDLYVYLLRRAGMAVASSAELSRVLASWTDHPADLILLYPSPESESLKQVEQVRSQTQAPLLVLTSASRTDQHPSLLAAGADAVLTHPVPPQLLTAQAGAVLRRANAVPAFVLSTMDLDRIQLDPSSRTVTVAGQEPKRLTSLEFRLLYVLMTHRGQVLPSEVIVERVWGYAGEGNRDLVRGLVSRLRHKIEAVPNGQSFIETIPGVGYRFTLEEP